MRRTPVFFSLLIGLILLISATGCSDDDPAAPEVYAGIRGVVVDPDGEPQEDVSIGLKYTFPGVGEEKTEAIVVIGHPGDKPMTAIDFSLAQSGHVRLWITDHAGDLVITLIDEVRDAGPGDALWTGLDDAGNPVPAGLYHAHLQLEDEELAERELFLQFLDPADFLNAPNAVTDRGGTFRIPDELIPVGETITYLDQDGGAAREYTIPALIKVVAVRAGDPAPIWTELAIDYRTGGANGEIELVLP